MATSGLNATVANTMLDLIGTTSQSGFGSSNTVYVKLHLGEPGPSGTANASAESTRKSITLGAASGGSKAATGSPVCSWTNWAQGTETISNISLWTLASGGTFITSILLGTAKTVNATDTLNLTALTLAITTVAS